MKIINNQRMLGGVAALFAVAATAQQASITLQNYDAQYCYTHNNAWTLSKVVNSELTRIENGAGTVVWTVTAIKSDGGATFTVHGGLTIYNSGSAPATIGNIVVNLQKPNSPKKGGNASHVSIAADVADATSGDAAARANVLAAGSQEDVKVNAAWGINNYAVAGAKGTFTETAGSGKLEFTDAANNTLFSLAPQPVIPAGQSITLLYQAAFQTSVLPPAGTPLRVEVMVTFGNAGARGGSGASGQNIDANGSGTISADEANVRTVPCRVSLAPLPAAPSECNVSATVTDPGLTTVGTVTASNPQGFEQFPAVTTGSGFWYVSADVNAGTAGGSLCNAADLAGETCRGALKVVVGTKQGIVGYTPIYDDLGVLIGQIPLYGPVPVYATYECAPAAAAHAEACKDVAPANPPGGTDDCHTLHPFCFGDFYSYTQGKFQSSANNPVANYLQANFATLFPAGLTVGIADGAGPWHNATWTTVGSFRTWIGGGGPSGPLTGDTLNASSSGGGALAKQTAALAVNLALSGSAGGQPAGLGALKLTGTGTSLDGRTISEILGVANSALGGTGLPSGYTASTLSDLITKLNEALDDGVPSGWANTNLTR